MDNEKRILDNSSNLNEEPSPNEDSTSLNITKLDVILALLLFNISIIVLITVILGSEFRPEVSLLEKLFIAIIYLSVVLFPISLYFLNRYIKYKTRYILSDKDLIIIQPYKSIYIPLKLIDNTIVHNMSAFEDPSSIQGLSLFPSQDSGNWVLEIQLKKKVNYFYTIFNIKSKKINIGPFVSRKFIDLLRGKKTQVK